MIHREHSAERINAIVNHEAVRPWVAAPAAGVLDLTSVIENQDNIVLSGEHGACAFLKLQTGVYEVHTFVLPSGRGSWVRQLSDACAHHIFTRTDAYEVLTRVPRGHVAAKAAALMQGFRYEFTRPRECRFRDGLVDIDIYAMRISDWASRAPGLVERGVWLHRRMGEEAKRLGIETPPHDDDENHNRYVGAAVEMIGAGKVAAGVLWYNRWALVARHAPIALVSIDPLLIRFDIGLMKIHDGDIEVIREC